MNHFLNIVRKEVRELLTPTTLIPIVIMALIFGGMGNMIGGAMEEAKEKPIIGLVNADDGAFSILATNVSAELAEVRYNGSSENDIEEGMGILEKEGGTALLFIPENFSATIAMNRTAEIHVYWIMRGAGIMDMISSGVVEGILQEISRRITEELVQEGNINASFVLSPFKTQETTSFKGKEMEGISPAVIGNMLSSQSTTVPIIMMIIIIMAGGMVISSMGMEKENKTLETLLTMPVKRTSIVAGKIVGSAVVGLIMAIIYMVGFSYYIRSFQESSQVDLAAYGLTLGVADYLLVGASVFFALLSALSLCMVLGTFAKNYKSAQTLTVPVSVLALIPMFITMFKDFDTLPLVLKVILFGIPFSHPMMAMRMLLFDNYTLVLGGIVYSALFALAMMGIAVWIFKTDKLLTGRFRIFTLKKKND